MKRTDPELLAVARGDAPADLVLRGCQIVNVFSRTVGRGDVAIFGDRIAAVGRVDDGKTIVDVDGAFVAPGFIDAHMHVESTMLLPSEFARVALPHGTTGVVLDPHEIANVLGIEGVRFLMDVSRDLPMNVLFAASSCVPASPLETAGAELSIDDLAGLLDEKEVVALAEMMNFPGVVHAVPEVLAKVALGLERRIVDGHCPGLSGRDLQAYVAAGISSDHESTALDEAREKMRAGLRVFLREGSAARNLDALVPLVNDRNAHRCCFCTDDRHPGDLVRDGHIDHVIRRAVRLGLDAVTAIAMATRHVADHYRQPDLGAVAPGCFADLVVMDDLEELVPRDVYVHGTLVARDGATVVELPAADLDRHPVAQRATVRLSDDLSPAALAAPAPVDPGGIRVIGMDPHQLVTADLVMEPRVEDGAYVADVERDLLKLAVIERHRGTGRIGVAFVHGFGLRHGALASTVGHDSHNLTVVGTNDDDMVVAARALADCGGGQCAVRDGEVLALLPLPIAGLVSDQPAEQVIEQQSALLAAASDLGSPHHDPFMPLSFLPLTVIPALKLSDRGLVDVNAFTIVPLEAPMAEVETS